jgi:hypothetical protein
MCIRPKQQFQLQSFQSQLTNVHPNQLQAAPSMPDKRITSRTSRMRTTERFSQRQLAPHAPHAAAATSCMYSHAIAKNSSTSGKRSGRLGRTEYSQIRPTQRFQLRHFETRLESQPTARHPHQLHTAPALRASEHPATSNKMTT